MRSRRVAAASLLALGLASALVFASLRSPDMAASAAPAPTTSSTTTSSTTTTSTTTPPTSTTTLVVGGEAPPPVDLRADTFDELRLVWDQIDAYWAWLNAHPTDDPTVLAVIFHPDGVEIARQMETMGGMQRDELRLLARTAIGEVTAFGCCPDPQTQVDQGSITLAIRTTWPDSMKAVLVDEAGATVEVFPGWRLSSWLVTLRRVREGEWLVMELMGQ